VKVNSTHELKCHFPTLKSNHLYHSHTSPESHCHSVVGKSGPMHNSSNSGIIGISVPALHLALNNGEIGLVMLLVMEYPRSDLISTIITSIKTMIYGENHIGTLEIVISAFYLL